MPWLNSNYIHSPIKNNPDANRLGKDDGGLIHIPFAGQQIL